MAEPNPGAKTWAFYHIEFEWASFGDVLFKNLVPQDATLHYICPYIQGEPYPSKGGGIVNPRAFRSVTVFGTDRPIDSEWPPLTGKGRTDDDIALYLQSNGHNCSSDAFNAAVILIESGVYKASRASLLESLKQNYVFTISSIGDPEVDRLYRTIVKPIVQKHGFDIARADEIRHTELITSTIYESISRAAFMICDLTKARPNCYYELGYAHALGKPCILLAKEGTERQFDVAGYRWNYWRPDEDFGSAFEAELQGVLTRLSQPDLRVPKH